jgi:hypothetical protein
MASISLSAPFPVRGMTVADAQTFAQQEKIRLGQGRQFVETGWTYQEEIR